MNKLICIATSAIAITLVLAGPASADARVHLKKPEARTVIDGILSSEVFATANPDLDWYVSYWIERASKCKRLSGRAVECDFSIFGEETVDPDTGEPVFDFCDGTMRIRERRTHYLWSDRPGECGTVPAEA